MMTSLTDRPGTALLVVDVQNGVVADTYNRDGVVANIATLVSRARADEVPVIWVQDCGGDRAEGSPQWEVVPELPKRPDEPVVNKRYGDSFEATSLESVLAGLGVGHLVVVGAQTDACIRGTLHGAFVRGYDVTLVTDAHTTTDNTEYGFPAPEAVIAHTNLYWKYEEAPGRTADAVPTAEVAFTHG
jgi:nicotinamidase-related amidase